MNAIETLVLEWVGEDVASPDVYADTDDGMAPIRDSVNAAIQELCLVTGSYVRTFHLPLVAYRSIYRILSARDTWGYPLVVYDRANHRKLEATSFRALVAKDSTFLQRTGTSPTEYYSIGMSYIGVSPKPTVSGGVLELRAVMIPKAYTAGTDAIHLRDAYQRAAAWYAVSEFYASRGDASRATDAWQHYVEVAALDFLSPSQAERLFQMGGAPPVWRQARG